MEELNTVQIRMVKDRTLYSDKVIDTPVRAAEMIGEMLKDYDREAFVVINLQTDGRPINVNIVSLGTVNQTIVSPSEVFKSAILSNAAHVMIAHNHPSGNLTPSRQDMQATSRIVEAGNLMGIPVLDSIIVGADNSKYYSIREKESYLFEDRININLNEINWKESNLDSYNDKRNLQIKQELKSSGYQPTEKLVNDIRKINQQFGKQHTVQEVKELFKNRNNLDADKQELLKEVVKDFIQQEQMETAKRIPVNQPEP